MFFIQLKLYGCRILHNASRQAWSLSFCHNRLGSQSPHALLDQIQDTERVPVPIGVSFFKSFCCLALPGAPNCEPCFGVAVWPCFVCPLNVLSRYPPLLRVGKQKARKSLFKSCQAPRRVEPSEDAFSTEAWCPNGHLCG